MAKTPPAAGSAGTKEAAGKRPGDDVKPPPPPKKKDVPEFGGPAGPEPTRYGDWERKGRVSDF
jgi:hypothetical protein